MKSMERIEGQAPAYGTVNGYEAHAENAWAATIKTAWAEIFDENRRLQRLLAVSEGNLTEAGFRAEDMRIENASLLEELKGVRVDLARAQHLAYHDPLTGVRNRTLLLDRLHQAVSHCARYNRQCALLILDLDGFKTVNDTFGHQAGDEVLCQLGQRLKLCVRLDDTVGRLGGDEFLLLLPEIQTREDAGEVARKVLLLAAAPYRIDSRELHLTLSMGIAIFPDDGNAAESLVRSADVALYQAKAGDLKAPRTSSYKMLATAHDAERDRSKTVAATGHASRTSHSGA